MFLVQLFCRLFCSYLVSANAALEDFFNSIGELTFFSPRFDWYLMGWEVCQSQNAGEGIASVVDGVSQPSCGQFLQ